MLDVAATNNVFSEFAVPKRDGEEGDNELGQSAFLELMITQLKNQDPTSPQDSGAFISQLAQFSSVESLDKLNKNFDSFANNFVTNQALQASSLVGRSVTVPADTSRLELGGVISLSVDVPLDSEDVTVSIYSEAGSLVDQIFLGIQPAGEFALRWDGMSAELNGALLDWRSGEPDGAVPGDYRFEVETRIDGETTALDTALSANVNSVTVGSNGALTLNLAGVGAVSLEDVRQFNE
ncbi:MAG: flagellar biosynthesis protein FlgD [Alteromonadaceae bacterium]|nr:MAG: flagellar biosynthesis protein FlgD [Alteromonadaceae bacterium]